MTIDRMRIVTQLDSTERNAKGQTIIDDCAPSALMACANYLTGTTYTSADGVRILTRVGRKDVQGVPTPTSLAQIVKAAPLVGLRAVWPKSWQQVVDALRAGGTVIVNVQQPRGYPATVQMSAWHARWQRYWSKHDAARVRAGYGHATAASAYGDGAQWGDPTMSGTGRETYAVPVSWSDLRSIASSKGDAPHKRCVLLTVAARKPAPAPAPAQPVTVAVAPVTVQPPARHAEAAKPAPRVQTSPQVDPAVAITTLAGIVGRIAASRGDTTMRDQIIAAALDALQAALSTAIAVFLGLGVSIFDLTGDGAKAVAASAISAALLVLQRWLDEDNTAYGRQRK